VKIKETNRLFLREFNEKDLKSIHEYASNSEVVRYQNWGPNTIDETRHFLENAIKFQAMDDRLVYELAVVEKKSNVQMGGCRVAINPNNRLQGEIGYIVHHEHWNVGYGTEIAKMLIDYAFDVLKLTKLVATCDKKNASSYRVLEQNGFRFSCEIRGHMMQKGELRDTLEYVLERKPKHIFAIGGGEVTGYDNLPIDRVIVDTVDRKKKKALFISTASKDEESYVDAFRKIYEEELGCLVSEMTVVDNNETQTQLREKILSSDIIYVGEGNTKFMLATWKKYGIQKALKEAYERGITIAGLSAGAVCWFKEGFSDIISFLEVEETEYDLIDGLNFINVLCCPNFNKRERREKYIELVKKNKLRGIAIEDYACMEIRDGRYRILKSKASARVYQLYTKNEKFIMEELDNDEFISIYNLF